MRIDRRHPIAEPTTPTHSSKSRKVDRKSKSEAASKFTAKQQNGPDMNFPSPNGRKAVRLKNLEMKGDGDHAKSPACRNSATTPTNYGVLTKSPEVRLNKVTTPTRNMTHPFPSAGGSAKSSSQEGMSQPHPPNRDHESMDVNSLWTEPALSTKSQDRNFLPSFDSDTAFQQLSLSPPLHHGQKMQAQQHSQHRHNEGRQDSQRGGHSRDSPQLTPHEAQRGGHSRDSPQLTPHEAQRGGHSRDSPQLRPPPPSYQHTQLIGSLNEPSLSSRLNLPPSGGAPNRSPHQPSNVHPLSDQPMETHNQMAFHQQGQHSDQFSNPHQQRHRKSPNVHSRQQQYLSSQLESQRAFDEARQTTSRSGSQQQSSGPSQRSRGVDERSAGGGGGGGGYNPVVGARDQPSGAVDAEPMNESLSIPTLHDLHSQQSQGAVAEQQQQHQRNVHSPLGIPPFHHIQMHRNASQQGTNLGLNTSPNAQALGTVPPSSRSPSSQLLHGAVLSPRTSTTSALHQPQTQRVSGSPKMSGSSALSPLSQPNTPPTGHFSPLHQQPHASTIRSSISPLQQQQQALRSVSTATSSTLLSPLQQRGVVGGAQQALIQHHPHLQQQQQVGLQQHDVLDQQRHHHHQHGGGRSLDQESNRMNLSPQQQAASSAAHLALLQQQQQIQQGQQFSPQKVLSLSPQHHHYQQQQQQQMLQLQQQAQAQRQFLLQQQRKGVPGGAGLVQNHGFLQGSAVPQYFAASSSAMANASKQQLAVTHPQLSHPQFTHLSALHPIGHGAGAGNVLSQQQAQQQQQQQHQIVMGVNPYASFGQGVQLLPNGTTAIPGAGAGFQLPGQTMGSPLRHFHSQGR